MRIKDMPPENRPRERMLAAGASSLSNAELLAVLLGKGTKSNNAIDIANTILSKHPLENLASLSLTELKGTTGIGTAKALQVKAAFELARRNSQKISTTRINSPQDAFKYAESRFPSNEKEYFMVILLNSKNVVIGSEIVSAGTLSASLTHPREIFRKAIKENAYAILVAHNHPSGDPAPSEEDKAITKQLAKAGEIIGMPLLDHLVIGKGAYRSIMKVN